MRYDGLNPEKAGCSAARLGNVQRLLGEGVEEGLYSGAVVWLARHGFDAFLHAVGKTDFSSATLVDEHTLFDLASMTKPIATATSYLLLCQDGDLNLDRLVKDFFPERSLPHLQDVTLRHLLTHVSGLPAWKDYFSEGQGREQLIDQLFDTPLEHEPGTHYSYSCLGYMVLGLAFDRIAGGGLDEFARERIFNPLGMTTTMFNPGMGPDDTVATTGYCALRKRRLVGEVHDENAYTLGGVSGNAGLFSTMSDLAVFCRAITFGAFTVRELPFGVAMINLMLSNMLAPSVGGHSIGWFTFPNDLVPGGDFVSRTAVGHSGFTGTAIIIDPGYDLAAVILTNRVCSDDDGTRFRHLRRRIMNALLGSVVC